LYFSLKNFNLWRFGNQILYPGIHIKTKTRGTRKGMITR
jgi:hypothetical protein